MRNISSKHNMSSTGVTVSLTDGLAFNLDVRHAMLMSMEGIPYGTYVIGTLQRVLDFSSYKSLLQSLIRLRDITSVAADVIFSVEGMRADRYVMVKEELIAHINSVIETKRSVSLTSDEKDLISRLIVSFEANPSSWTLYSDDGDSNLHAQVQRLYNFLGSKASASTLSVYASESDKILDIKELPQYAPPVNVNLSDAEAAKFDRIIQDGVTLHALAAMRVVDHVYQLMVDKDAWYNFVSPRYDSKSPSGNIERGRGLKLCSLYCQSLLSYSAHFMLEAFLASYDVLQSWMRTFPPLEPEVLNRLEVYVRKFDLLDASTDARHFINSMQKVSSTVVATSAPTFPQEFAASFGVLYDVDAINSLVKDAQFVGEITDLRALNQSKFLPLISTTELLAIDIVYSLTRAVVTDKVVAAEINEAISAVVPGSTRIASDESIRMFREMNLKCTIPFEWPVATEWRLTSSVEQRVESNTFLADNGSPTSNYDYMRFVRKDLIWKAFSDELVPRQSTSFSSPMRINHDIRLKLAGIIGSNWQSLAPSWMYPGADPYEAKYLRNNKQAVKNLFEKMTGLDFAMLVRELGIERRRKFWATVFSSFCTLYVDPSALSDIDDLLSEDPYGLNGLQPVVGWGNPYGTSYMALDMMQGPLQDDENLVKIVAGVYARFHTKVPIVDPVLAPVTNFHGRHRHLAYASNGVDQAVDKWIIAPCMFQHAMFPVVTRPKVPAITFSENFVFLNSQLYLHLDASFSPNPTAEARQKIALPIHKHGWPYDRLQALTEWVNFGKYTNSVLPVSESEEESAIAKVMDKIANQEIEAENNAKVIDANIHDAAANVAETAEKEVETSGVSKESAADIAKENKLNLG